MPCSGGVANRRYAVPSGVEPLIGLGSRGRQRISLVPQEVSGSCAGKGANICSDIKAQPLCAGRTPYDMHRTAYALQGSDDGSCPVSPDLGISPRAARLASHSARRHRKCGS